MSKRMTAEAFTFLKRTFPNDFADMPCLEIEVSSFNNFRTRIFRLTRNSPSTKKKSNKEKYGEQLADIIEWLDENINEPYFPRVSQDQQLSWDTVIEFYFMDEADAMAFKLMFT